MARILLVEPNYQNKYPPIGLMKISTYHKNRGDIVEFYKGEAPYGQIIKADRIYITSMFTFHYDITVKTIRHYLKYAHADTIYIGGIAVSLLSKQFAKDTGIKNILEGLLTDSSALSYDDNVNIDRLPLDYDILEDVSYVYPAGDNYFIHATRGCPRGCLFCAVRLLEPTFETTNSVVSQIQQVDKVYGPKRNLLMMDNNILCTSELEHIINDIVSLGFTTSASYLRPNQFTIMMGKIARRQQYNLDYSKQLMQLVTLIDSFGNRIKRYPKVYNEFESILTVIKDSENKLSTIHNFADYLTNLFDKYSSKSKLARYVDFNQGIDARLINKTNSDLLAKLPLRPLRLAFDDIKDRDVFLHASRLLLNNGLNHFSNYLLYNWNDYPEHLWERLDIVTSFYNSGDNITGFSFPMKYAPIDQTDRTFVGQHWNKKYLRAINVIVNVTNGVVTKERDFFEEAFGHNVEEYLEILTMPDEFIRYRKLFKMRNFISLWSKYFNELSQSEKERLLMILSKMVENPEVLAKDYSVGIKKMLLFYSIKKQQVETGALTADMLQEKIVNLII